MFNESKYTESDIMMRSILSEAREEVPEHIWEGISSGLDKIEVSRSRKPVVLWFKRSAVAVAAAAAVAVGVFINRGNETDILQDTSHQNLIAVIEPQTINLDGLLSSPENLAERSVQYLAAAEADVEKAISIAERITDDVEPSVHEADEPEVLNTEPEPAIKKQDIDEFWIEEEDSRPQNKVRTSIVMSGITGTNNAPASGKGPMRRPSLSTSKPKTGVEQKSSESTYGLPISLGAGVKIDFNRKWSVGIGANYSILTRKFFGTYTMVNSNGAIDESISSDIRNVQQYIGIPVNVFYNILNKDYMNFYVYGGGSVEKCISDKYDILNTEYIYKSSPKGVQLSANIGLGVEFLLGRHLGLYVDPSLRYYFDCNQPKSIRTSQPLMMGLEMGLRIKL